MLNENNYNVSEMRLGEEKTLMILEVIALLFILLFSIGYDIANEKLDDHRNQIYILQNKANNLFLNMLDDKQQRNYYTILSTVNIPVASVDKPDPLWTRSSIIELWRKFNTHQITSEEYINGMADDYQANMTQESNAYNYLACYINQFAKDKMIFWNWIKKICNWVRIGAILVSAFLYLCIYRQISQRYVKQ